MHTKILSPRASSVIDQYLNFRIGQAVCTIPYFNNLTARSKVSLRTYKGKGSPQDIFDELEALAVKDHIPLDSITNDSLIKTLVDSHIGIDCSGFAYYVLNAESLERGKGSLDKHISFVKCKGMIRKIRCSLRPVENCDVLTLADNKNSRIISLKELVPGDMITLIGSENPERNHILVIHQIEYQNDIPLKIHYSHSISYPEDGLYSTGIKQGTIEIALHDHPITEALWTENGKTGEQDPLFIKLKNYRVEVRRLNWF